MDVVRTAFSQRHNMIHCELDFRFTAKAAQAAKIIASLQCAPFSDSIGTWRRLFSTPITKSFYQRLFNVVTIPLSLSCPNIFPIPTLPTNRALVVASLVLNSLLFYTLLIHSAIQQLAFSRLFNMCCSPLRSVFTLAGFTFIAETTVTFFVRVIFSKGLPTTATRAYLTVIEGKLNWLCYTIHVLDLLVRLRAIPRLLPAARGLSCASIIAYLGAYVGQ